VCGVICQLQEVPNNIVGIGVDSSLNVVNLDVIGKHVCEVYQ
jgi:hypothetical protein